MASNSIGNLNVQLNLEIGRLQAQIDTANGKIRGLTRKMEGDFSKAAKNINKALGKIGLGLSAAAVVNFGKAVLELGGQITDLSNQAGISTDAFQTFSNVAAESGVDAQQVANAFVQMRKNIQEGTDASTGAGKALADLGLNADRLQALAPERQFEQIAKAIATATDKNKAFNAGLEILGAKNAPKLTEVLQRLGTEGLDAISKSVEKLRLSPEQLKSLDDAGDKLTFIWTRLKLIAAQGALLVANFEGKGPDFLGGDAEDKYKAARKAENDRLQARIRLQNAEANAAKQGDEASDRAMRNAELEYRAMENIAAAAQNAAEAQAKFNSQLEAGAKAGAELEKRIASRQQKDLDANLRGFLLGPSDREREAHAARSEKTKSNISSAEAITAENLTPLEKYNSELSKLNDLKRGGFLTSDIYERAVTAEGESYQKATNGAREYKGELDDLGTKATELDRQLTGVWENVSDRAAQSFADILIDGESTFNELPRIVARALAEIAFKMAVINPLINGLFGLTGGAGGNALPAFFGAGATAHAGGGRPDVGEATWIGERGKELWVPDEPGMIIPNHRLGEIGGSGGNTYNIDARGADVGAVARLERSLLQLAGPGVVEKRSLAAGANERKRGGGLGRAFGS